MTSKAIPLVQQRDGVYECVEAGLALLRRFTEPVAVVVVGGRYRSGKSFLLNRGVLCVSSKQGFPTGSTVNACTKGIWIYPQLVRRGRVPAIVLDTEGTSSMEATPEQDAKLLSVAVSMASTFVFNSSGALDEASFAEIGIVAHAAKSLQNAAKDHWDAPRLFWTLRDFSLQLEDPSGHSISPDEYLEACLSEKDKGESRALLREYFVHRSLVPLVRPVAEEAKLQRLNALPEKELRVEFVNQLQLFTTALDQSLSPKSLAGRPANGAVLAHLCQQAVAALNEGVVPCVSDSFTFLLESQLHGAVEVARAAVDNTAGVLAQSIPCPPEHLHVPRPEMPSTLATFASIADKFAERVEAMCVEADLTLSRRNDIERKKWLQDLLEHVAKERNLNAFIDFLETAHLKIGLQQAYEAAALVFEACVESLRENSTKLERALAEMRGREENSRFESESEAALADNLRTELEDALLRESNVATNLQNTGILEIHEHHCEVIATELSEKNIENAAQNRQLVFHATEIDLLREELTETAARMASTYEEHSRDLRDAEEHALATASETRAVLAEQEAAERGRLESVKVEMLSLVGEAQQRSRSISEVAIIKAAEAEADAADALLRARKETELCEEATRKEEIAEAQHAQRQAESAEKVVALRRQHTESLAEKTRMMRDAHDDALVELRRSRERATESDRAKVRLEIENESQKRSLDTHKDDLQQLAKVRRYAEELRDRLNDRETTARTSAALLDDHRRRLADLEEHGRDLETHNAASLREKDYRIAMLEVQLSAAQT